MIFFDDFDTLHQRAIEATGLDDFGTDDYGPGLRALLDSLEQAETRLDSVKAFASGVICGVLAGRLITQRSWSRTPEVLAQGMAPPLIIVGIPRSGTTALQQLLAADPQFQGLEQWLSTHPKVRPPKAAWPEDPDYRAEVAALAQGAEAVPEITAMHNVLAEDATECLIPMAQMFCSNYFGSMLTVPEYDAWFLASSQQPALRRYRDILRLVGFGDSRTWLLKNPSHLLALDDLLAAFPDARIIQTHRDPAAAMASTCSLLMAVRKGTGTPDRVALAQYVAERETGLWQLAVERAMDSTARRQGQIFDVDFRRFNREPLAVVADIYGHFGLTLSAEAEAAMTAWLADNPPGKHGAHQYSASDFGLDPGVVRERFGPYIGAFNL